MTQKIISTKIALSYMNQLKKKISQKFKAFYSLKTNYNNMSVKLKYFLIKAHIQTEKRI